VCNIKSVLVKTNKTIMVTGEGT